MVPDEFLKPLQTAPFTKVKGLWEIIEHDYGLDGQAWLGRFDRFYLLTVLLNRPDAFDPWLYERCREVEAEPDDCLDLWAREHYKSTIITFAGAIQEINRDPEITIGIFSHTKPVARKFLNQIKFELETNEWLKGIYPDIYWADPRKESSKWSLDGGLVLKRQSNPKEATIEAHGLVDGQPTGAHFKLRIYDDVVTRESVGTPEQVHKTTDAWSLSDNLGARGEDGKARRWHVGTRYSFRDTYQDIIDLGVLKQRIYPATDNGLPNGNPVFLSPEVWEEKKKNQISHILAAQMLQNPAAGTEAMFSLDWLKYTDVRPGTLNVYILTDPASSRKRGSDRTAMLVVGVDAARNKWLLDGYYHRMALRERWENLRNLRRYWMNAPGVQQLRIGYERYGMQSDIEYMNEQMQLAGDIWDIEELNWPREGGDSKIDRIQRLEPDFRNGRIYLPLEVEGETSGQKKVKELGQGFRVYKPVRRKDENGRAYTLTQGLLDEYPVYPYSAHDDFLDALSRIYDMDPQPPVIVDERTFEPEEYVDGS